MASDRADDVLRLGLEALAEWEMWVRDQLEGTPVFDRELNKVYAKRAEFRAALDAVRVTQAPHALDPSLFAELDAAFADVTEYDSQLGRIAEIVGRYRPKDAVRVEARTAPRRDGAVQLLQGWMAEDRALAEESPVPSPPDIELRAPALPREAQVVKSAIKFFDLCDAEFQLDEALMRVFGATVKDGETDPATWPCRHMVYDPYDSSFELWNVKEDAWVPSREQLDAAFALGFARCWICYPDGTERYYAPDRREGQRKPSPMPRNSEQKYLLAKAEARREAPAVEKRR